MAGDQAARNRHPPPVYDPAVFVPAHNLKEEKVLYLRGWRCPVLGILLTG